MARFLKFKKNSEKLSASSSASERLENIEQASGEIASDETSASKSSEQKRHRIKVFFDDHELRKTNEAAVFSSQHEAELERKVHDLESKLQDFEEFIRKKETSEKLARHLNQLQPSHQPVGKELNVFFKHVIIGRKDFRSKTNLLIAFFCITSALFSTFLYLNITQPQYELSAIYRFLSPKKKPDPDMLKPLAAYMSSDDMFLKIIAEQEILSPKESVRQHQIQSWLQEYRSRIKVLADEKNNLIKFTVSWNDPEKTAATVKKITDAYSQMINTQKSLDDYLQYLRKAIDKSLSFALRDKVFVLTESQKRALESFIKGNPSPFETQLADIETELVNVQKNLSPAEEVKFLSLLKQPQSVNEYVMLGLRSRLEDLEAAAILAQITKDEVVMIKDYAAEILLIKNRMKNAILSHAGKDLNNEESQQLLLTLKKMQLEIRKEALLMLSNKQYGTMADFSIHQKEYLANQKNILKLLENFSFYSESREVFNQTLEKFNHDKQSDNQQKSETVFRPGFSAYGTGLGVGIFLAWMLILIRRSQTRVKT